MQRLRIRFCRGEELKFISHLDLMRLWQRALTRAGLTIAYSEGFSPHPRISLAVPLALGITSRAELMDIFLAKWSSPHFFTEAISQQLPTGITILQVHQIPPELPSLQSQVRFAEYEVKLETEKKQQEVTAAISALLSLEQLPWQHQRDTGPKHYDLRKLIDDIWLTAFNKDSCTLGMRLRCDNTGSGRPEQVATALSFKSSPNSIERMKLILTTS
ncbi:TIGR03936 family radical SAM-associated protein [Chloroflexota bacterium]